MSIGFLFWLLMVLWLVLGGVFWSRTPPDRYLLSGSLLVYILLFLLGWKVFGFVIHG